MAKKKKKTKGDLLVFQVRLHYRFGRGREAEIDRVVLAADDTEARKKAINSDASEELVTHVQGGEVVSPELQFAEVKFIAKVDIP